MWRVQLIESHLHPLTTSVDSANNAATGDSTAVTAGAAVTPAGAQGDGAKVVYRAAVVGLGFIGSGDDVSGAALGQATVGEQVSVPFHSGGYASYPARVQLVCGSSRNPGRRERFEQRHPGAKAYSDWKQMIDTEELDIVSVCTYTVDPQGHDLHTEISLYCMQKGIKAVWCEKPVVASMDGGDALLQAAAKHGCLFTINHNRRWEHVTRKLQRSVQEGLLGDLVSAEVVWPSGRAGVAGTHLIDTLLMITGQRAVAVSGMVDETPFVDCRNNSDNADFVAIQGETNVDDPGCYGTLKMSGGLVVSICAGNNLHGDAFVRLYGSLGNAAGDITVEIFGEVNSIGTVVGAPRKEVWKEDGSDGLNTCERCVREIVAALDGELVPFPYDPQEGVHTCEILLGIRASHAKNGVFVPLPMAADDRAVAVARWA